MTDPRVTGAVRYSQDVRLDGMLHARFLRSSEAHARIVRVDASAVPDDVVVLLPEDVRDLNRYGPQIKDQEVLPQERVRYAGDVVAAVAAESVEEAEEALLLIDVEYEALPAVFDEIEAASEGAPLVHESINMSDNDAAYFGIRPQQGTNTCHLFRLRHGDTGSGFEEADLVLEETYHTAGAMHAPMEPHAAVASLGRRPSGGYDRHADPVQPPDGSGRALRSRREEGQGRLAQDGWLLWGEDVYPDGGDSGVPGAQGREAS